MKTTTPIKIVLLGDQQVGKTSLSRAYESGHFQIDCLSLESPLVSKQLSLKNGTKLVASVWDTYQSTTTSLAPMITFMQVDVCLLCFSVESPESLENIETRWLPLLRLVWLPSIVAVGVFLAVAPAHE